MVKCVSADTLIYRNLTKRQKVVKMMELNESNFTAETGTGLVLVDFHAQWCGPCRMLAPVLEQVTGVKIVKVNTDENPNLAAEYSISSIPRLLFMKDGKVVDQLAGLVSKQTIQSKVDALKAQ
jgi:thioredoxin 1